MKSLRLRSLWPDVGQVVGNIPRKLPVPNRILAQKVGAVRADQVVGDPGRDAPELAFQKRHGVLEAARDPLGAHGVVIGFQRRLMAAPHSDRGVVQPTARKPRENSPDLPGLEALLAEPAVVEAFGAVGKAGVGQEGLHYLLIWLFHHSE